MAEHNTAGIGDTRPPQCPSARLCEMNTAASAAFITRLEVGHLTHIVAKTSGDAMKIY
jgi:hypothetical protein